MPPPEDDDDAWFANTQLGRWSPGVNGNYNASHPYGYFDFDRPRTLSSNSRESALSGTTAPHQSYTVESLLQGGSDHIDNQQTSVVRCGDLTLDPQLENEYHWWDPENWDDGAPFPDGHIYNEPNFWTYAQPLQAEDGYHVPDDWSWGISPHDGDEYYTPENWSLGKPADVENGLMTTTTSPGRWSPAINGDYDAHEPEGYFDLGINPNTRHRRRASHASREYVWHDTPARQQSTRSNHFVKLALANPANRTEAVHFCFFPGEFTYYTVSTVDVWLGLMVFRASQTKSFLMDYILSTAAFSFSALISRLDATLPKYASQTCCVLVQQV